MPKTGNPFSPSFDSGPQSGSDAPAVLPDLLAGLMNHAANQDFEPVRQEVRALTPEVMAPEEEMPPATPVNTAMPEFLASLRTLLESPETVDALTGDRPPEAVQDFAHGTNELLNYLLCEVVGTSAVDLDGYPSHPPEAAHDFEEGTNELLSYLLSEVDDPTRQEIEYSPEAMADFAAGTRDLLNQLLAMTQVEEPSPAANSDFQAVQQDLLDGLMDVASPLPSPESEPRVPLEDANGDLLGGMMAAFEQEREVDVTVDGTPSVDCPPDAIQVSPQDSATDGSRPSLDDLTRGLLDGLLANLTDPKPAHHGLGEVPLEYVDESDQEVSDRPAGPFEKMLDQIDAELPAPPAVRGIAEPDVPANQGERVIAFDLAGDCYALPFECVLETDRIPRSTHVPGMPAFLRGVLNLRGEIIPLVDLRMLFGLETFTGDGRMLVIRSGSGDGPLRMPIALVVDRLIGLASLDGVDAVEGPTPEIPESTRAVLRGFRSSAGRTLGVLDPDRVTAAAQGDGPSTTIDFHTTDKRNGICLER